MAEKYSKNIRYAFDATFLAVGVFVFFLVRNRGLLEHTPNWMILAAFSVAMLLCYFSIKPIFLQLFSGLSETISACVDSITKK